MSIKKVGLFGGTFDPIHMGHLNLAFELMEKKQLDQVWFIPVQLNPHKTAQDPPVSFDHRLAMTQLALEGIPYFFVKDVEKQRPPPSYTIHTLQAIVAEEALNPGPHQFYLLMGEDALPGFIRWHLPEEIVRLVPLLIGSRSGSWLYEIKDDSLAIWEAIQKGLTPTRLMDVSSTEIRQRFKQGLYCGHLVPASVLTYIQENQLYPSN